MEFQSVRPFKRMLIYAREALGLDQGDLARAMGVSRRTIIRWQKGQTAPVEAQIREFAAMVREQDEDLADELLASAMFELLVRPEEVGTSAAVPGHGRNLMAAQSVVAAPEASAALARPPQPPAPAPPHLIDAIVCAAADAADMIPRTMRPPLRAAFSRAAQLGLSIEAVVLGLSDEKNRM
jgi:transcriptional regulator with XRE-family HTH domain